MVERHISSKFEHDLDELKAAIAAMGKLVEQQIRAAIKALEARAESSVQQVLELEQHVNHYEVEIDRKVSDIIARRQPTASDLRLVLAISKISTNLERTGDEAVRVAKLLQSVNESQEPLDLAFTNLGHAADLASNLLHKSLEAFASRDVASAVSILREDREIDSEYNAFVSKLIEVVKGHPEIVSSGFSLLFLAKALERIGDHSKNIAEAVIYAERGFDIRHIALEDVDSLVASKT